ncbi:MAG TPA: PAS domain-containing protein, partial [Kiloniellaceae bacterium]
PTEIPWALGRVFLVDYSPQEGFRYRLAGAEIAAAFGRANMAGLRFSDFLPPDSARFVEQRWMPLVRDRCVVAMTGMIYFVAERTPIGERILLPLAEEAEGPVTGVFGMAVCEWMTGIVPREARLSQIEYLPIAEIP